MGMKMLLVALALRLLLAIAAPTDASDRAILLAESGRHAEAIAAYRRYIATAAE